MVALTGAVFEADLDGTPVAPWKSLRVKQGSMLSIKAVRHSLTVTFIASGHGGCTLSHSRTLSLTEN